MKTKHKGKLKLTYEMCEWFDGTSEDFFPEIYPFKDVEHENRMKKIYDKWIQENPGKNIYEYVK